MARRYVISFPSVYAGLTGLTLVGWWVATLLDRLPVSLQPAQQQASHVAAELTLAAVLLVGAVLDARGVRVGRLVLSAALGALVYASVNVLGDFPHSSVMIVLLVGTTLLSAAALVVALLSPSRGERDVDAAK